MNDLTKPWDSSEREAIGFELRKLFALQDKPLTREKEALVLEELERTGIVPAAIGGGIRKLMTEDVPKIKLATLVSASLEVLEPGAVVFDGSCDECGRNGIVTMIDGNKHNCSLACECAAGNRWISEGLLRWNGEKVQYSKKRGRMLLYPLTSSRHFDAESAGRPTL